LPDSVVDQAMVDLAQHRATNAVDRLARDLQRNMSRATRKIDAFRKLRRDLPEEGIFHLITQSWLLMGDRQVEFLENPRWTAEFGAAVSLANMESRIAIQAVGRAVEQLEAVEFILNVLRILHDEKKSHFGLVPPGYDLVPLIRTATDALLAPGHSRPLTSPFDHGAMGAFWAWSELDRDDAQGWLRHQVDSGAWKLLDTIGALTSVVLPMGQRSRPRTIGDLQIATVSKVFGLETVFNQLSEELDTWGPIGGEPYDTPATPENRTAYALAVLRRLRAEQGIAGETNPAAPPS
jgi:hypothetical protein